MSILRPTNFSGSAIDALNYYAVRDANNRVWYKWLAKCVDSGQKFILPDDGDVMGMVGSGKPIASFFERTRKRLPYPITVIEFHVSDRKNDGSYKGDAGGIVPSGTLSEHYSKICVLAVQEKAHDDEDPQPIMVTSVAFDAEHKEWTPVFGAVKILNDCRLRCFQSQQMRDLRESICPAVDPDTLLVADFALELSAVVGLIAANECINIEQAVVPAPERLNKKRRKAGKRPLDTYRILELASSSVMNKGEAHGTHASPRQHFRRGHIRHLPGGNVWVNSCVVGSANKGIARKDYAVAGQSRISDKTWISEGA